MLSHGLHRGTGHTELNSCTQAVLAWIPLVRSIFPLGVSEDRPQLGGKLSRYQTCEKGAYRPRRTRAHFALLTDISRGSVDMRSVEGTRVRIWTECRDDHARHPSNNAPFSELGLRPFPTSSYELFFALTGLEVLPRRHSHWFGDARSQYGATRRYRTDESSIDGIEGDDGDGLAEPRG